MPASPSADRLRRDALAIWQAGVDAVRSEKLVHDALRVDGPQLAVGEEGFPLAAVRRIAVVGAGKAGAGMAAAVEEILGPRLLDGKHVTGWVNVPEDCLRDLSRIHLHGARPAGVNEPTEAGAAGSREILRIVGSLGPDDLCLCLISGGGSALLPAPVEEITLADKLAVTRHLSAAGANIEQLNAVRKQLSRVKGGGLARACRAGTLVALIISDVLGDPLDVIASGPTVEDPSTPQQALAVLEEFRARQAGISARVFDYLSRKQDTEPEPATCRVRNLIIGNNARAVDAAGEEAVRLGYSPAMQSATEPEGLAEEVGVHLARMALRMRGRGEAGDRGKEGDRRHLPQSGPEGASQKWSQPPGPDCLITGGEPVVRLAEKSKRGLGGRNQQLVLAALEHLESDGGDGIAILSGGTDGEDGPTDAAGAVLDAYVLAAARDRGLDPADFLARNDAYRFFEPLGALIKTGPTHTNVCDVRVAVVARRPGA